MGWLVGRVVEQVTKNSWVRDLIWPLSNFAFCRSGRGACLVSANCGLWRLQVEILPSS